MRKKLLITIGIILLFLLLVSGCFGVQIYRYIRETDKSDRAHYSWIAHMPYFADYIEDNGLGEFRNGTREFLQTKKFRSPEELSANLPVGFSDAINEALASGASEKAVDLKNKPVTLYEINPELLPLEEKESDYGVECHYFVMEYPDKKYRFVLITDLAYTR